MRRVSTCILSLIMAVTAFLALAAPAAADEITITFDGLPPHPIPSYSESGLTVVDVGTFGHITSGFPGMLTAIESDSLYVFTLDNGQAFDLVQVDVSGGGGAASRFDADTGESVIVPFPPGGSTHVFEDGAGAWTGIHSLTWHALSHPIHGPGLAASIDNLVLRTHDGTAPVPEPATLALLGIGGLGIIAYRKRRKA